jgi:hypothetical protein
MISKPTSQESDPVNNPYWDEMRNHDYKASFAAAKNFLHQNESKMTRSYKERKRGIWILSMLLLPLLVVFSCQRKTYIEPQGATLTFCAADSLSPAIEGMVRGLATKDWRAIFMPRGGKRLGTVTASAQQYERLKAFSQKLMAMPGVTEIYLSALKTAVEESRLSRLTYHIFDLHLDARDATDVQLRHEIAKRIKDAGQENLQLELVKVNGKKQVTLVPTVKTQNFSLDFTLPDGTNVTAMAEKW